MSPDNQTNNHHKTGYLMLLSGIGLIAVFVLIVFARSVLFQTIEDTRVQYEDQIQDLVLHPEYTTQIPRTPQVFPSDPVIGSLEPLITIIEYGDFQCPFCADMSEDLRQALTVYPTIRLAWKDLPNPLHPQAETAALAAKCAQVQGKFWEYHDLLFENQNQLRDAIYLQLADQLEFNTQQFQACLREREPLALVSQGLREAREYGIDATPYLFIGSTRVDRAISFVELQSIIEQELNSQ